MAIAIRTKPIPADRVQDAINALIDDINVQSGHFDSSNVTITGGTIDNTPIGATDAAFGAFDGFNCTGAGNAVFDNDGFINFNNGTTVTFNNTGNVLIQNDATCIIHPGGVAGQIDNMNIGLSTPKAASFSTLDVAGHAQFAGGSINGSAVLATNATTGHMFIPVVNGVPTGAPTLPYTGAIPLVINSANSKLYALIGGTWTIV